MQKESDKQGSREEKGIQIKQGSREEKGIQIKQGSREEHNMQGGREKQDTQKPYINTSLFSDKANMPQGMKGRSS
jgi:hypothetical protein